MKNWIFFRLLTALLAFMVGVLSSQFRSSWQRKVVATESVGVTVAQPARPVSVETWRKVVVKDRFSFYVPPYLEVEGQSLDRQMAIGGFRKPGFDMGGLFYFSYVADDTAHDLSTAPHKYKWHTKFDVMFGGKHAVVVTEIPSREEIMCIHDVATVKVYFPNIGHGQNLYLSFASGDVQGIEVAKRILESIEFVR